jgi:hypothetical protein
LKSASKTKVNKSTNGKPTRKGKKLSQKKN